MSNSTDPANSLENEETRAQAQPAFCANCGAKLDAGSIFCANCGAKAAETPVEPAPSVPESAPQPGPEAAPAVAQADSAAPAVTEPVAAESAPVQPGPEKKGLPKKVLLIGGIALAAIVVVVLAMVLLFGGGGKNNYALYLQDQELFYTEMAKVAPVQVTGKLVGTGETIDNDDLAESAAAIGYLTVLSKDGKILFYPDRIGDSEGITLYFRYLNKPKAEAVKIDSDIVAYAVNEKGNCVTYLRSDGMLYQHNLKEKTKIASEIAHFYVTPDGKKLVYLNEESTLYSQIVGKDREQLDIEVSLNYVSEDLSVICYIKDDILYLKKDKQDKIKISSDVYSTLSIYESGQIYFLKSAQGGLSLSAFVNDDMQAADADMIRPEYPSYPFSWDFDTQEEYQAAVDAFDQAVEDYNEAYDAYLEKSNRDDIRESLKDRTLTGSSYDLYYYDGKEVALVIEGFTPGSYSDNYSLAADRPVMVFKSYDTANIPKIKLSEASGIYDLETKVEQALSKSMKLFIATGGTLTEIEQSSPAKIVIDDKGSTVYYLAVQEDQDYGELYKVSINGGKVGASELYDNDVSAISLSFIGEGKLIYYKDVKDYVGELYVNKERIDYDVELQTIQYAEETDTIVYLIDWDDDRECGTLKTYARKKAAKVADDVNSYEITPGGEILYLRDYNLSSYRGELFVYQKNKSKKVADDVIAIVPVFSGLYRNLYSWYF